MNYTEVTEVIVWTVLIIAMVVVEALTAQIVTIWFAAGGLVALIVAIFKGPVWLQILTFVLVSVITLIATRPLVKKLTKKNNVPLNAHRIIGKKAVVTESIDNLNSLGAVKVEGNIWTARSSDNRIIEAGKTVEIEKIEGVKVIVKEV